MRKMPEGLSLMNILCLYDSEFQGRWRPYCASDTFQHKYDRHVASSYSSELSKEKLISALSN